jgi:uncharacterized membrane protein
MPWQVFIAALLSAFLHAAWNAAAKKRRTPSEAVLGIIFASVILCVPASVLIGPPPFVTWKWMLFALPLNAISVTLIRVAYDWTEYGLAYPLARGIIPPLLAAIGWYFGETLSSVALLGMTTVLVAFVLFALKARQLGAKDVAGLILALLAGVALAVGLFCDRNGARLTDIARTYGLDYAFMTGLFSGLLVTTVGQLQANWAALIATLQRGSIVQLARAAVAVGLRFDAPIQILKRDPMFCFVGGLAQIASFVIALWAYAKGPVAMVAALRETNVLFAGLLAWLYVCERITLYQWFAIGLTCLGAVLIKFG